MKFVSTDKAAAAVGPYSQAVDTGSLVFVSGQLGLAPGSGEMAEGFAGQVKQALANLKAILHEAGIGLDNVALVEVFLTDMGAFPEFNTIYALFFGDHKPARAVVEVSALPKGGLVEIKCTACR